MKFSDKEKDLLINGVRLQIDHLTELAKSTHHSDIKELARTKEKEYYDLWTKLGNENN